MARITVRAAEASADDRKTVAALDTQYQAAVKKNDAATMERLLAEDFVLVRGSGKAYTKADLLGEARSEQIHYEHQKDTDQTVRIWGDTAVVMKWVKAILKVTPQLRWHPGQFGEWESSIVPILSLEVRGTTLNNLGAKMNEPAKHRLEVQPACAGEQRGPFVVRESEVERAPEIAAEFYPQNKNLLEEQSGAIIQSPGNAELCARICELARMLGYNAAKTKMLVGQWRLDLVRLERKLQNELDEGPQIHTLRQRGTGSSCKN